MLQNDTEDQLNRPSEKGRSMTNSQVRKEDSTYKKQKTNLINHILLRNRTGNNCLKER